MSDISKTGRMNLADMAHLIAHSGYLAYRNTLIGGAPPILQETYRRMTNPKVGDLVLEITTYRREPWDPGGLGYLDRVTVEPAMSEEDWDAGEEGAPWSECPTMVVHYLRPFVPTIDGKHEVRWHNAEFIALPTSPGWIGIGTPTG